MRRRSLAMGVAAALMAVTGCAFAQQGAPAGPAARWSEASARLGFDLLGQPAKAKAPPNPAVSPASLAAALSLLDIGADAPFRQALRTVLRLDDAPSDGLAALRGTLAPLLAGGGSGPLSGVGAVYFDPKSEPLPAAIELLRKAGAQAEVKDLSDPATVAAINALVKDRTGGLIPGILDAPLTKGGLVVLDALHFKDDWQTAFDPSRTTRTDFHPAGGRPVKVAMMQGREEALPVRREGRFLAVALPYRTKDYSLILITTTDGPARLADFAPVAGWLSGEGFADKYVTVALPRFTIRAGGDLLAGLDDRGLKPARLSPTALSGFSSRPQAIDRIVQKVVIAVDEKGTEAAAATAITTTRSIAGPPPLAFVADKPFLFALHDAASGQTLIEGYVGDPSKAK
ncbi:serpin family protein [Labrys monachus]|uniref:Serpin B n=1 Tax=Labrys monachus TaxID=217067 RepID=A0ABU0FME2_9HYPH|nr:serpin family protein [Labrys monachus]MDQ0395641.1 serpin B [Labrys monachus]